jgi:hypothetical protein
MSGKAIPLWSLVWINWRVQLDGIRKAKERGVHFGRKKKLTPKQIIELQCRRAQGALIKTLMHDYGIAKVSVYRYLGTVDSDQSVVGI